MDYSDKSGTDRVAEFSLKRDCQVGIGVSLPFIDFPSATSGTAMT